MFITNLVSLFKEICKPVYSAYNFNNSTCLLAVSGNTKRKHPRLPPTLDRQHVKAVSNYQQTTKTLKSYLTEDGEDLVRLGRSMSTRVWFR